LGALVYWLAFEHIGWRGMFALGILPALLVLYIRRRVPESPVWAAGEAGSAPRPGFFAAMRGHWRLFGYLVVLMAFFNMFSHGSQDVYVTFLKVQRHFDTNIVSALTITLNLGAICGGLVFGAWSEHIGRRRAIIAAALLALPMIPLWAWGGSVVLLGIGVFLLQVMVQGAWGVVPVHLNELSPDGVRGTLPGFAYQGGNLLAAFTSTFLAWLAARHGGDFALAMAGFIAVVAVGLAGVTWFGPEARGRTFD
ncbi:MAG: MFS transporter, partial [Proteobacteria bacterium]|nr:MFS transporter [Pseudomonadota bacterium]